MWLWNSEAQPYFKKQEFARTHLQLSSEILNLINCFTGISEKVLMDFSVPSAVFPENVIALY